MRRLFEKIRYYLIAEPLCTISCFRSAFPRFAKLLFMTYYTTKRNPIFTKNEPVAKSLTHLSFSNYLPRNYDLCKLMLFQMNDFHSNHISAGFLQQNLHVNVPSL